MEKVRILIADDERIERLILCRKLSREFGEDCELIQAENGKEAVEMAAEHRAQIAVLDIAMPGINGVEAASRIRQADEDCILVFLTAYSDFSYTRQAIRLRAMDYLTKPYDDEELFSVIEAAIYQARSRRKPAEDRPGRAEEASGKGEAEPEAASEEEMRISEKKIQEIRDFIAQNYMHDISMQDAAAFMNYSDTYFCKLFKHGFGSNFTTYLTRYRMKEAARLLKTTDLPVREVASRSGYADPNYFAKVFKRQMGVIPREYRG